jgi:ATP-dependent DNA helicase RecQ
MDHGGLRLTEKGRAVLKGETFMGAPPAAERAAIRAAGQADYDVELFEQLRQLRLRLAQEAAVPPYVVFSDAALRDMAIFYPQSRESFGQMSGVGAVKLERYGEAFLEVIGAYCRGKGLAERPKQQAEARPARVPSGGRPRREQVTEMYLQGESPEGIAQSLNIQWNSVMFYLWQSVLEGVKLDSPTLLAQSRLSVDERKAVFRAFAKQGTERLQPVYEALQETVPYEELHILRLYYVTQHPASNPMDDSTRHDVRQAILRCVEAFPGQLPRSGVAKLLVGSDSERIADYTGYPEFGRFSHLPRHIVMAEVDKLIAEEALWLDEERHLRM